MSTGWDIGLNIASLGLSLLGFLASIASYRQSSVAALEARSAQTRADDAARHSQETVQVVRKQMTQNSIINQLNDIRSLGAELDTQMGAKAYSAVLIRSKDLSKQLSYFIGRWTEDIPPTSVTHLVDANSKLESLTERLQKSLNVSSQEHLRLARVVSRVVGSVSNEHAIAEKRRDTYAGPSKDR